MRRLALLVSLLACLVGAPVTLGAEIVVFDADSGASAAAETAERERDLGFDATQTYSRALKGFAAELTPEQALALRADPDVAAIVPDRPVRKLAAVPVQPGSTIPPGVRRAIQAPANTVRQTATHAVAVLDTGVDLDHPDLDVVPGTTCAGTGAPDDVDGHGTHVAGTIAAKDNGFGVVGVAPGTKIVAVKVLDDTGNGSTSTVLCGIDWVIANRITQDIEVANLSLGGAGWRSTCANDLEHNAYCRLAAAGVTTVVAAGNEEWDLGASPPDIPASYPEVLTVSAMADTDGVAGASGPAPSCSGVDADDRFASFSNFATLSADLSHMVAAPGVCIRSTYPGGGTARMSGTSMAAPHVAGLVALCHGEAGQEGPCSSLTTAQVVRRMVDAAKAATGTAFTPDLANPNRGYGPFAVLPSATNAADPLVPVVEDPAPELEPEPTTDPVIDVTTGPTVTTAPPPMTTPAAPPADSVTITPSLPAVPDGQTAISERKPRLTIVPARLRRFAERGLVARVSCAPGCRVSARVTVVRTLSTRRAKLPVVLARASLRNGTIVLKPNRLTRGALLRAKRVVVTVRADVTTPNGSVVRLSRTVALR